MAYAGSSRPCSGSEHLISHALDRLDIGDDILHGQKVGRASLFTTYLQGNLNEKILKLVQSFDVPITFVNNFISDETLLQIFETCRIVRPGRKTVLDKYSNKELLIKYHEFQSGNY
jgi:glycerol-1-phosphate dehydrogenase [NAD(P)+]